MRRKVRAGLDWARIEAMESRLHLNGASVARPSYNTGTGFFVLDGRVYDANGIEFIMKGPNNNHAWGSYTSNYNAIDHIARTGSNAARALMYQNLVADPLDQWTDAADTPARRQAVVERYLANGVVPVVEDHASIQDSSSQSNTAALHEIVTHWLDNTSWLKQYESGIILNIANEWGPNAGATGSNTVWRDAYITQVGRLRAGLDGNLATQADNINALIMIDAGGWGQDINTLQYHAQQIVDADPQRNIVFSIHLYGQWRAEDRNFEVNGAANSDWGPWDIYSRLAALKNRAEPLALVVGEWAWEDFRDFSSLGAPYGAYRTRRVMEICDDLGIGYLGWSWNHSGPETLNMIAGPIQNYQYNSNTDLTDWGNWIVNDPDFGTKASARRATVFPLNNLPAGLPTPANEVRFVLEQTSVTVAEAGQGAARVRLSKQPTSNVAVTLGKIAGGTNDADVNLVTTGLLFTPDNWNIYQPIVLAAASDVDSGAGTAKFQLAAADMQAVDFLAREVEPAALPPNNVYTFSADRDRLYNGSGSATSVTVTSTFPPNGAPNGTFFMRFNLGSLAGKIASATLRVFTTNTTAGRYVRVFHAISDTWTESATTPINASYPIHPSPRPAGDGFLLPTSGGSYVNISFPQLTDLIRAEHFKDGLVTLALRMVSGTASFQTDEGANRPQLVLSTVEAVPPQLAAASFDYLTNPNRLRFTFSEDVADSLDAADVVVESLTQPGLSINAGAPIYDPATHTASFALSPGVLPDGNYRARLLSAGVSDAAGNAMLADSTLDFFALAGDANRDRVVDITDLGILATNWQQSSRSFAEGDFNYDGTVDITDLGILATNWQVQAGSQVLGIGGVATLARRGNSALRDVRVGVLQVEPPSPLRATFGASDSEAGEFS